MSKKAWAIVTLAVLPACTSPDAEASKFMAAKFPVGSDAMELRAELDERGYYPISAAALATDCMFRKRPFGLASGDRICWETDSNGKLRWSEVVWLGPAPAPLKQ